VPLIISGPVVAPKLVGKINHAFGYVKDLAPTLLDIIGVPMLGDSYQGESVEPMTGKILTPLLTGQQQSIYNDADITAYEIGGNKALFKRGL
jgi:arylsulfatase A-like enzyme